MPELQHLSSLMLIRLLHQISLLGAASGPKGRPKSELISSGLIPKCESSFVGKEKGKVKGLVCQVLQKALELNYYLRHQLGSLVTWYFKRQKLGFFSCGGTHSILQVMRINLGSHLDISTYAD